MTPRDCPRRVRIARAGAWAIGRNGGQSSAGDAVRVDRYRDGMADQGWDDFPVVEPEEVEGWWELEESGIAALLAWEGGPTFAARTPDNAVHLVDVTIGARGGPQRHYQEPRTAQDQEHIDEYVNEFLEMVGVPARPGGYRWLLKPRTGWTFEQLMTEAHRIWSAYTYPTDEVHQPIRALAARLPMG